jgi:Tfp pilus assembly ATPase PilU
MVTMDDGLYNRYAEGVISREDCQDKAQDYNGMLMRLKEYDEEQAALAAEAGADPGAAQPGAGAPPPPPPAG